MAAALRQQSDWLVTYDVDPRVLDLYSGSRCAAFSIKHTAARQHIGREYAVFADNLVVDSVTGLGVHGNAHFVAGLD